MTVPCRTYAKSYVVLHNGVWVTVIASSWSVFIKIAFCISYMPLFWMSF